MSRCDLQVHEALPNDSLKCLWVAGAVVQSSHDTASPKLSELQGMN